MTTMKARTCIFLFVFLTALYAVPIQCIADEKVPQIDPDQLPNDAQLLLLHGFDNLTSIYWIQCNRSAQEAPSEREDAHGSTCFSEPFRVAQAWAHLLLSKLSAKTANREFMALVNSQTSSPKNGFMQKLLSLGKQQANIGSAATTAMEFEKNAMEAFLKHMDTAMRLLGETNSSNFDHSTWTHLMYAFKIPIKDFSKMVDQMEKDGQPFLKTLDQLGEIVQKAESEQRNYTEDGDKLVVMCEDVFRDIGKISRFFGYGLVSTFRSRLDGLQGILRLAEESHDGLLNSTNLASRLEDISASSSESLYRLDGERNPTTIQYINETKRVILSLRQRRKIPKIVTRDAGQHFKEDL